MSAWAGCGDQPTQQVRRCLLRLPQPAVPWQRPFSVPAFTTALMCPGTETTTTTYPFDVTEDEDKEDPEENSDDPSPNQDDNLHIGPVIRACGTGVNCRFRDALSLPQLGCPIL